METYKSEWGKKKSLFTNYIQLSMNQKNYKRIMDFKNTYGKISYAKESFFPSTNNVKLEFEI